ncbi:MAG: VWA domain-containing protein [Planctomycetaceae bacterium]|nr:VWA domain-containing protein [Planctomycetaceae bacterium]
MRKSWKSARRWFPAVLTGALLSGTCSADDAIVRTYHSPDGTSYAAVSLALSHQTRERGPIQHVVLLDTSASQVGEHRKFALELLDQFLTALPEGDTVQVLAYDVKTAPLTDAFVDPQQARTTVTESIAQRIPAGSSNLLEALETAKKSLGNTRAGSILVLGDGMSSARLIQPDEAQQLTSELRKSQIPIHSFAVGGNTDLRLLGILAEETGGVVMRDEWSQKSLTAAEAGAKLADATHRQVLYPTSLSSSDETLSFLPNRPLPLRSDRTTVYLATGDVDAIDSFSIQVPGRETVEFTISQPIREDGNTFLAGLWAGASQSDGVVLGLAGEWMVNFAHQAFEDGVAQLENQGFQALTDGNFETAERIGFHLQSIDPNNSKALRLINRAAQSELMLVAQLDAPVANDGNAPVAQDGNAPVPDGDDAPAPVPSNDNPPAAQPTTPPPASTDNLAPRQQPTSDSAIEQFEQFRRAQGQKLQREVELNIEEAYDLLNASSSTQAEDVLDRTRGLLKSSTEVAPELRAQLTRRVDAALQDIRSKAKQIEAISAERQRRQAEEEATARLLDFAAERDRKLQQMVDRIRALMEDGFHGNPNAFEQAEAVAREVESDYPQSAIGTAVVFTTEAAGQLDKASRLRSLRADRFLETLHQVELSHVPFPDEPPVRYPPAEVWWALTEIREKWKNVDLRKNSPNERKIDEALDQITSFEFPGNPLRDVMDFVSEQHGIPIVFDPSVQEIGIDPETEQVELVLSGITLRSALKLMLEKIPGSPLTYIIEDEVMKIIDSTIAEERLQTRVYPVADLVIPVQPLQGGFGGGLGGGGLGGGQGQGGGLGGGQQGGGFGGGQQGGGQGGGFFSVPARPATENAKKKPLN